MITGHRKVTPLPTTWVESARSASGLDVKIKYMRSPINHGSLQRSLLWQAQSWRYLLMKYRSFYYHA
ncbi:MAG: hypothetical protein Q9M09_01065 [Mariprofundaceae bacterium]|nr:hypothetical protein [Mariprofundaceae bacterium]